MTTKLFIALYVGLFVGMFILFFTNFVVAWVFFAFVFVTIFGGMLLINHPTTIAGLFLLASLIVLGAGGWSIFQLREVGKWPTAPGVITRSWYCTRTTNGTENYSGPCIEYTYTVNEKSFAADSIDTGEFSPFMWPSPVDRFKVDHPVQVYYDPTNPGVSRLSADISSGTISTIVIGGIMAVLSLITMGWTLFGPKAAAGKIPSVYLTDAVRYVPPPVETAPRRGQAETDPGIAGQLEKLADLHWRHEISDEEFEAAKKQVLGM